MSKKAWLNALAIGVLLIAVGVTLAVLVLKRPKQIEIRSTPFSTHESMLAVTIAARRLASPSIDDLVRLEKGRVSSNAPGDGQIKLLDIDREELFVLDFEVSYSNTSDATNLRDQVLMTFVLPYSPEVAIVRVETPQGSAEQRVKAENQ